ncbi:MAG: T9SS type A sorting domain-containing protein [Cryomorphaceae bacterium]|nr:T9SS type A sorting domain-containing protein [Flavobacteriales bacterium]
MKLLFRLIIGLLFSLNSFAQCDFSIIPSNAGSGCINTTEDVVFTNMLRVTANGNRIVKTGNGNGWNAGGSSTARVYNGGHAQTVVDQTNTFRMFGLSENDNGVNPNTIQFAFYLQNNGNLRIVESGNDRGNFGSYANSDVLSIRLEDGVVSYIKNESVLYVSNLEPPTSMVVDISLRNNGARLDDVTIHNKSNELFRATLSGNPGWFTNLYWSLDGTPIGNGNEQIAVNDFEEGAVLSCTLLSLGGDCGFLTTSNQIVLNSVSDFSATDFYITAVSQNPGCFTAEEQVMWDRSETSNLAIDGNSLSKLQGGNIWNGGSASINQVDDNGYFRFSADDNNTEKMIGLSSQNSNSNQNAIQYAFYLRQNGSIRIREAGNDRGNFGNYAPGDEFKIAVDGGTVKYYQNNTLVFISPNLPNLPLLADVAMNSLGSSISGAFISNLSGGKFAAQFNNLGPNPEFQWYVNGQTAGENSNTLTYQPAEGDVITCTLFPDLETCEDVSYASESITISLADELSEGDFHIEAIPDAGSPNYATEEVRWSKSSLQNVEATGSSIEKIQFNGQWNGNASSLNTVKNGGYIEFSPAQTNRACVVGLSNTDQSNHYNSIQYAFSLESNGALRIFESGANRGNYGTYNAGSTLQIIVDNGDVKYFKDGGLLYTSNIAPTLPLLADVSIKDQGGKIENATIAHNSAGNFVAVYSGLEPNPSYQWKLNGIDVGTDAPTYTNESLYNGDLVTCEINPGAQGCGNTPFASNRITHKNDNQATDWLGVVSDEWNNDLNWSAGVPDQSVSARIVANRPYDPLINTNAQVKDLSIQAGAEVAADQTFSIQIFGNFTNLGTFDAQTGVVTFSGEGTRIFEGNTVVFNRLIMNLSSPTDSLILDAEAQIKDETMLLSGVLFTGSNELVYLESAQSRQGSANSYVDGTCRKIGNRDFEFPVGRNGVYAPIVMSAPSEADAAFTATYFDQNPNEAGYPVAQQDGTMNNISTCEYWIFNRESGNSAVSVTLSYEDERSCGVTDPSGLCVARWDGDSWENHGYSNHNGSIEEGFVVSADPIENFSPFTLGSTTVINPLPIELVHFDVKKVGSLVKVNWTTSSETENDYFTVERSADGQSFSSIGVVAGSGNSHSALNYDFIDANPLSGTSYYRLRQTGFDGDTEVFNVKSVSFSASQMARVFPNPNKGDFSIVFNGDSNIRNLSIYSASGIKIWQSSERQIQADIRIPNPAPGLYILDWETENGEMGREKVIIK